MREVTKKDLERHAFLSQMIERGVCNESEKMDFQEEMNQIESLPEFFSKENQRLLIQVSRGIVKRRNAVYKQLLDMKLKGEDAKRLERYVYHVLQQSGDPDERVLTVKLNI